MSRSVAAPDWAAVSFPLPADTPSISGGGLVVEAEPNGIGRKVWLVATQPGTYLFVGQDCEGGDDVRLGEFIWETNQYVRVVSVSIFDGVAMVSALPFSPPICSIGALRLQKGVVERSVVEVNPWRQSSSVGLFPIGDESMISGRYSLSLLVLPADAIAIIGRSGVGEVRNSPFGSVVVFPADLTLSPPGPTTLTICSKGLCGSTIFQRKTVVEAPYSGGKG